DGLDEFDGSGNFGRAGDHAHERFGRLHEFLKHADGRADNLIGGMNAAARLADEGALEMDAENLGGKMRVLFVFLLALDVAGDGLEALAGLFLGGRNGGGEHRSGAEARHGGGDTVESARSGFHYIVPAGAVDMDVYEARDDRHARGDVVECACGDLHFVAMADGDEARAFDEDQAIRKFLGGRENLATVNYDRRHGESMLPEVTGKITRALCIVFLLRYNRRSKETQGDEWHTRKTM